MARRKRKEEEAIWKPPEFDEVGYMRQEIENAKIAAAVIAWAAVGAVIAYLLSLWIPVVGYLAGLAAFGALYYLLPVFGLPIHGFKRRDWMSHASVYFFSWLAFSIVLLNAPFGDHTNPVVTSFEVGSFDPSGTLTVPAANSTACTAVPDGGTGRPVITGGNQTLYVLFRATDNVRVASVTAAVNNANVTPVAVGGQKSACAAFPVRTNLPDTYFITELLGKASSYIVSVTAVDTSHLSTTATITVLPS